MKSDEDLDLLVRALDEMGVEVRYESCDSDGGLVRLRDQQLMIVNPRLGIAGRKELFIKALRQLPHDNLHLSPRIRALLGEKEWE